MVLLNCSLDHVLLVFYWNSSNLTNDWICFKHDIGSVHSIFLLDEWWHCLSLFPFLHSLFSILFVLLCIWKHTHTVISGAGFFLYPSTKIEHESQILSKSIKMKIIEISINSCTSFVNTHPVKVRFSTCSRQIGRFCLFANCKFINHNWKLAHPIANVVVVRARVSKCNVNASEYCVWMCEWWLRLSLIDTQGELVDSVEHHVESSTDYIKKGHLDIKQAEIYQSKARKVFSQLDLQLFWLNRYSIALCQSESNISNLTNRKVNAFEIVF